MFADATDEELLRIDQLTTMIRVRAGRKLTVEGLVGRDCMIVIEGRARVTRECSAIAEIGPGEMIGEMALLDGRPRSATVEAMTPMRLLVLHPGEFEEMVRVSTSVRAKLGEVVRERTALNGRDSVDGGTPRVGAGETRRVSARSPQGIGGSHADVGLA
jgi:CRP-like cAMP-binding protein